MSRNGPSHEGSPFDCRRGWSFKASSMRAAVGQEKSKKNTGRLGHYPGFRGSLLGETAHGSRPCC